MNPQHVMLKSAMARRKNTPKMTKNVFFFATFWTVLEGEKNSQKPLPSPVRSTRRKNWVMWGGSQIFIFPPISMGPLGLGHFGANKSFEFEL